MDKKKVVHSSFWTNFFNSPTEETDLKNLLKTIPIFKELTKRDLSILINIIHNRTFVAGERIFNQGDPGIGIYIVREGEVEIERLLNGTEKVILATFSKGDFFGELALVDGEKRPASAIAKTACKVSVIFKPDLDEFIEKYPKKGIKILKGISTIVTLRLRQQNEDYYNLQSNLQYEKGQQDGNSN